MGGPSNGVTTTTTTCIGSVTPGWKMTMSGSGINPSLTPSTVSTTSTLPCESFERERKVNELLDSRTMIVALTLLVFS